MRVAATFLLVAGLPSAAEGFVARGLQHPIVGKRWPPRSIQCGAATVSASAVAATPAPGAHGKPAAKVNLVSLVFVVNCLVAGLLLMPAMVLAAALDKRRNLVSRIGNFWGRWVLRLSGFRAGIIDAHRLPSLGENVVFVSNHQSYLDIPLAGHLGRPVKYLAKAEVKRIPVIGWKLGLAKDVCVERGDRRSEARAFVDSVRCLKEGNSLLVFPEGTTSDDGQLLPFKRGPFKMAVAAGVRVVPLTIVGTGSAWPKGAAGPKHLVPLSVKVHAPLDSSVLSEEELCAQAQAAVESGLAGHTPND